MLEDIPANVDAIDKDRDMQAQAVLVVEHIAAQGGELDEDSRQRLAHGAAGHGDGLGRRHMTKVRGEMNLSHGELPLRSAVMVQEDLPAIKAAFDGSCL